MGRVRVYTDEERKIKNKETSKKWREDNQTIRKKH